MKLVPCCEFARKAGLDECVGGPDGFKCILAYVRVLENALEKVLPYAESFDPAEYGICIPTQEADCEAAWKLIKSKTS